MSEEENIEPTNQNNRKGSLWEYVPGIIIYSLAIIGFVGFICFGPDGKYHKYIKKTEARSKRESKRNRTYRSSQSRAKKEKVKKERKPVKSKPENTNSNMIVGTWSVDKKLMGGGYSKMMFYKNGRFAMSTKIPAGQGIVAQQGDGKWKWVGKKVSVEYNHIGVSHFPDGKPSLPPTRAFRKETIEFLSRKAIRDKNGTVYFRE